MDRLLIKPIDKANEFANKFGISTAKEIVTELIDEVFTIGSYSLNDCMATKRKTYWTDVIKELDKLEY